MSIFISGKGNIERSYVQVQPDCFTQNSITLTKTQPEKMPKQGYDGNTEEDIHSYSNSVQAKVANLFKEQPE